jgi:hypothetical protein
MYEFIFIYIQFRHILMAWSMGTKRRRRRRKKGGSEGGDLCEELK